jgi:hypothetical protein
MNGWTKENAVNYCIKVAQLNLFPTCKDAKALLKIYQNMLFPGNEQTFYRKLWKNAVINYLKNMVENRYENPAEAYQFLEIKFMREPIPENLEQFVSSINNLKSNVNDLENINILKMCMSEIQDFVILQLNKLYKKNISGPECLLKYIYPYASHLILPSDETSMWLIPSLSSLSIGLNFVRQKHNAPKYCSFCNKQKTYEIFAAKYTQYNYFLFTVCIECIDFKKYYSYCFLGDEDTHVIELLIDKENKIDCSCLEKK